MDHYFISSTTDIKRPNALIYNMVVDEKIITMSLLNAVQTAAHEELWRTNLKHTDIIWNNTHIDVKKPSSWVSICYEPSDNISIAILYGNTIYITSMNTLRPLLNASKSGLGYYISTSNFIKYSDIQYKIDPTLYAYYQEQQKIYNEIDRHNYDMQEMIDLYNTTYEKYFETSFDVIRKSNF